MMRLAGSSWRLLLWVVFPPLGWYRSRQATARRRHREVIRELRRTSFNGPGVHVLPDVDWDPAQGLPPSAALRPPAPPGP